MNYLLDKSEWRSADGYTLEMMGDLVLQYREILSKVSSGMCSLNVHTQL